MDGHLADDVRGRAEAVEPEPGRVAGEPERPIADQAATKQRRRLLVAELGGEGEAVAFVGDGPLGIAAVDVAAGETGTDTQVLAARAAVAALSVGPAEPGDADPATIVGGRDDLVAEDDRELGRLDLGVAEVQVGPADATGVDGQAQLGGAGDWVLELAERKRLALPLEHHCAHCPV